VRRRSRGSIAIEKFQGNAHTYGYGHNVFATRYTYPAIPVRCAIKMKVLTLSVRCKVASGKRNNATSEIVGQTDRQIDR